MSRPKLCRAVCDFPPPRAERDPWGPCVKTDHRGAHEDAKGNRWTDLREAH